jgi:hypothetical protein
MSISVFGVGGSLLLNTVPVSCENRDLLELALGPKPIIKLIAWGVATLKIDFIGTAPDILVTWSVVYRSLFRPELGRRRV